MAEELYFFRFNKEVVTSHLLPLFAVDPTVHTSIKITVADDIESFDNDQLWLLFSWFSEQAKSLYGVALDLDDTIRQTMLGYGIDLFFEIPSKTPVRKFHSILSDYEFLSGKEIHRRVKADEFQKVLDYMIHYTGEVMLYLNDHYYQRDAGNEPTEITTIISAIKSSPHNYLHSLAQAQCDTYLASFRDALPQIQKLITYRNAHKHESYSIPTDLQEADETESDAVTTGSFYYTAVALKEQVAGHDGSISMLHSF